MNAGVFWHQCSCECAQSVIVLNSFTFSQFSVQECVSRRWMTSNRLHLNDGKTSCHLLPYHVKNLCFTLDSSLSISLHVNACRFAYTELNLYRLLRRSPHLCTRQCLLTHHRPYSAVTRVTHAMSYIDC